ncbi:MAG: hypothetical protein PF692_11160 [Kiritimatiellae bacterium]|jgi:hypothetical protein|nr:hypothetical protein [Kiritimatiellia bacterium]
MSKFIKRTLGLLSIGFDSKLLTNKSNYVTKGKSYMSKFIKKMLELISIGFDNMYQYNTTIKKIRHQQIAAVIVFFSMVGLCSAAVVTWDGGGTGGSMGLDGNGVLVSKPLGMATSTRVPVMRRCFLMHLRVPRLHW